MKTLLVIYPSLAAQIKASHDVGVKTEAVRGLLRKNFSEVKC
ncbi:hypothetical protein IFVP408_C2210047 [Vibrio parahaemolyticus]